ncbi:DUF6515 family protein [Pararcticibacter amylolyticus]|nr:DUF6515 family protein [Pararcticibacter amylolyticus]
MKSLSTHINKLFVAAIISLLFVTSVNAQRPSRPARSTRPSVSTRPVRPSVPMRPVYAVRPSRVYYSPARLYSPRYYGPVYRPFYRYYSPWLGLRFRVLPWGYVSFNYGPDLFYYYDGIFYRNHNDYYEVVTPPVGAEVPGLPAGAKEISINGQLYYEKNGVYYQEIQKDTDKKAYVVAGKDGELNTSGEAVPQEGDVVDKLPEGSRKVVINGLEYYLAPNGFYYQQTIEGDKSSFRVVGSSAEQEKN